MTKHPPILIWYWGQTVLVLVISISPSRKKRYLFKLLIFHKVLDQRFLWVRRIRDCINSFSQLLEKISWFLIVRWPHYKQGANSFPLIMLPYRFFPINGNLGTLLKFRKTINRFGFYDPEQVFDSTSFMEYQQKVSTNNASDSNS